MSDAPNVTTVYVQDAAPPKDATLKGLVWLGNRAVPIRVVLEASGRVHGFIHTPAELPLEVMEVPESLLEDA